MNDEKRPLTIDREGKTFLYDILRRKYVVWTPEEVVRQDLVNYLLQELKYPKGLISIEAGLHYNRRLKRTDIVVFNKEGKPNILVECKRPEVKLGKEAIFQLSTYNKELDANLLVLTNGKELICLQVDRAHNTLISIAGIPPYK